MGDFIQQNKVLNADLRNQCHFASRVCVDVCRFFARFFFVKKKPCAVGIIITLNSLLAVTYSRDAIHFSHRSQFTLLHLNDSIQLKHEHTAEPQLTHIGIVTLQVFVVKN